VINAFKLVHTRFPDSILGIAGDGSERNYLEKLVSCLNLSSCVRFYGSVDHATMHELYDHYDILVNASHRDNQPLAIIEAFASGLPVVSTGSGGIPYMLEDGITGLLVEVGDCEALAKKVIEIVENRQLSLSLARNARAKSHEYSWQHVKNLLLPLFAS
jgi:glycosyltransferase involved in cell wall biosynthesis